MPRKTRRFSDLSLGWSAENDDARKKKRDSISTFSSYTPSASEHDILKFLAANIFLPPKLPSEAHPENIQLASEAQLLELLCHYLKSYIPQSALISLENWGRVCKMVNWWKDVSKNGIVDEGALNVAFDEMFTNDALVLHITAQNAGLIIRRTFNGVVFECFEVSALNASVMGIKGSLIREFPGRAVIIPSRTFDNTLFRKELVSCLSRLSSETVKECMPISRKAGTSFEEVRDTIDPKLVTEMLMALLIANGDVAPVDSLRKRVRDEICWDDTVLPWRRSPLWLVARVSLQVYLFRITNNLESARTIYKNFLLYTMAQISEVALKDLPDTDTLYIMNAKLARRAAKLGEMLDPVVSSLVLSVAERIHEHIANSWTEIQAVHNARRRISNITFNPDDTRLSLKESRPYLVNVLTSKSTTIPNTAFTPQCETRLKIGDYRLPKLSTFNVSVTEQFFALVDFENWVEHQLPSVAVECLSAQDKQPGFCSSLGQLMEHYYKLASILYVGYSEQLSIMILTLLEMWMFLDMQATALYPLLSDFSPEIPLTFSEPLLLPKLSQMERLQKFELYLTKRYRARKDRNPSIFADPSSSSFAAQFFSNSSEMKQLRTKITQDAEKDRGKKRVEWKKKQNSYDTWHTEEVGLLHNLNTNSIGKKKKHAPGPCKKCELQAKLRGLNIGVHEWPLPEDEGQCRAALFELVCPLTFLAWREATWLIVQDLGRGSRDPSSSKRQKQEMFTTLSSYHTLHKYAKSSTGRLTIGSTTKSFSRSHYGSRSFPVKIDDLLVKNAHNYRAWDSSRTSWLTDSRDPPSIAEKCRTLLPPSGPYCRSGLQYAVDGVRHSDNDVIAAQSDCASDLNIHEYLAFGSLRAGERIQWLNILRVFAASDLGLNSNEVCSLFSQAAWQVGTGSKDFEDTLRVSHCILREEEFTSQLLEFVDNIYHSLEANWKEIHSMMLLIIVVLRILSLGSEKSFPAALQLLDKCRRCTFKWASDLVQKLDLTQDAGSRTQFQHTLIRSAIICRMTFDVDVGFAEPLSHPENIAVFIQSSVFIQENLPTNLDTLPVDIQRLLRSYKRLSIHLERCVREHVSDPHGSCQLGLNLALRRIWTVFKSATPWSVLPSPNQRWVTTRTDNGEGDKGSQIVHLNLLSGELLIGNRPIGRLPTNYTESVLYKRVLGMHVLRVVASDIMGMTYMTAQPHNGSMLYFHIGKRHQRKSFDTRNRFLPLSEIPNFEEGLIIRTKHVDSDDIFQLVPRDKFNGDLPKLFITNYVHWMNLSNGEIEFRPLSNVWVPSPTNWRLCFASDGSVELTSGLDHLVDCRSRTCDQISEALSPLEERQYLHIFLTKATHEVQVHLPRLDLSFMLDLSLGQLRSLELRANIDLDQNIGALFGLDSYLAISDIKVPSRRSVLIPMGDVLLSNSSGEPVRVSVHTGQSERVKFFRYDLDPILRKLRSHGDPWSIPFLAYLHAVTSSIMPDPFTGRTGTEEALSYLEQKSLRYCFGVDAQLFSFLDEKLAALTPKRSFYPTHLKSMQRIKWNHTLSSLIQNDEFNAQVVQIIEDLKLLDFENRLPVPEVRKDSYLLERARFRNSWFHRTNVFGQYDSHTHDGGYWSARDSGPWSQSGDATCNITKLVREWPSHLGNLSHLPSLFRDWSDVAGFNQEFGVTQYSELLRLPLNSHWGSLYDFCRGSSSSTHSYSLMFLFSAIAFGEPSQCQILRTLLCVAFSTQFQGERPPPRHVSYCLENGDKPQREVVQRIIKNNTLPITVPKKDSDYLRQQEETLVESNRLLDAIMEQWPGPRSFSPLQFTQINTQGVEDDLTPHFAEWSKSRELILHIGRVSKMLGTMQGTPAFIEQLTLAPTIMHCQMPSSVRWSPPSIIKLMQQKEIDMTPLEQDVPVLYGEVSREHGNLETTELHRLIGEFRSSSNPTRCQYGQNIYESIIALEESIQKMSTQAGLPSVDSCNEYLSFAESNATELFSYLVRSMEAGYGVIDRILRLAGFWPTCTVHTVLSSLLIPDTPIPSQWRRALVILGKSLTRLQRAERIRHASIFDDRHSLSMEFSNRGHINWDPHLYPSWLLMEIENNFLIRPIQAKVAFEMMSPKSGANTVMQLNMGEGKSSVILPLLAAALADGSTLIRIVVLKSLAKQTGYLLSQRLGGLLNRRVYYTPLHRQSPSNGQAVVNLTKIYHDCLATRGVLLIQPEHMLSFRLLGIDKLSTGSWELAAELFRLQIWLQKNSRDVLDESDEILDVRSQLIYTIGNQTLVDCQPHRWIVIQSIFDIVARNALSLRNEFPGSLDVLQSVRGSFPSIRFIRADMAGKLIRSVISDIDNGYVPGISFDNCEPATRRSAFSFIEGQNDDDVVAADIRHWEHLSRVFDGVLLKQLILLRGLIKHGILLHVLCTKRWNVNYGLDPSRCLMAVPYRGKGVPSPNSEFGHPDVALALTSLSYYYTGLTCDQLRSCFLILFKMTDPSSEYLGWSQSCESLPKRFSQIQSINMADPQQLKIDLHPHFKLNKRVIDFYLSQVVFPKEAKEFPWKLTSSAWDIPLRPYGISTTGFSGTNDNRFLLPSSIQQDDLPELQLTNAKVLSYLLYAENRAYRLASNINGQQPTVSDLLQTLLNTRNDPLGDHGKIRVLIDVGAQVIDMTNLDVVREWLTLDPTAQAAIFFDEQDELMILDRLGRAERFNVSRFQDQMDQCVVYLDEIHTRGIDLKFPQYYRAAVTLGPKLTKDKLVQACMRMRKLGFGQSVLFIGTPEVHQSILDSRYKEPESELDVRDVLLWCFEQTCDYIEKSQPLRISHGLQHRLHELALQELSKGDIWNCTIPERTTIERFISSFRQRESKTLEELYSPSSEEKTGAAALVPLHLLNDPEIHRLLTHWNSLKGVNWSDSSIQEEQEREVAYEVQQEREVQRPPKFIPYISHVHDEVRHFVKHGSLYVDRPSSIELAFSGLNHTSAAKTLPSNYVWFFRHVLASPDFTRTVQNPHQNGRDAYIRPVQWVLRSLVDPNRPLFLLISPFEANELLLDICNSPVVQLFVYSARVRKTASSVKNVLVYCLSSPHSRLGLSNLTYLYMMFKEVNIFAGQLYLTDKNDYLQFLYYLGLVGGFEISMSDAIDRENVCTDGFVAPQHRGCTVWADESPFHISPLPFLNDLLGIRRKGEDFSMTHLGHIISARTLKDQDFCRSSAAY